MEPDKQQNQDVQELPPILDRMEKDITDWYQENRNVPWVLLAVACLMIVALLVSPLVVYWLMGGHKGKDWSELVKNFVESGALLAAVFATIKWVYERRDRATEVLLKLDGNFQKKGAVAGKKFLEKQDYSGDSKDSDEAQVLDGLLRFYVVLYGVLKARQVPERSLSICFRYWLAYYFRRDREKFRKFVNDHYPTLSGWLHEDHRTGCHFFRPYDFWKEDKIENDPQKLAIHS